jgi:adenine phosphoribosyltransferase
VTDIRELIRSIPDYPKAGILFRDVTTLFKHPRGFRRTIDLLAEKYADRGISKVVGIEARGFVLAAPLAYQLGAGFVPVRKKGKLPAETIFHDYALEYGTDRVELHVDAIERGEKVLVLDDLIATGGTALAAVELVRRLGGDVVECAFVVDLPDLGGRRRLEAAGLAVHALLEFDGH